MDCIFSRRYPFSLPRIAEILLVCFLCIALCAGCIIQPASAVGTGATVAVAGGAVGTGGIPALGALGGLLTPTLGVIGAVLLGAGVNVYITEESAAQGMTKTQFIEQSLRNWVHERGGSFDDLIGTIADGIHVSPLGKISLTGAAGLLIYQFGNWLFANDAVSAPDSSGGTIGSLQLPVNYITLAVNGTFPVPVDGVNKPDALSASASAMCVSSSWTYSASNNVYFVCCNNGINNYVYAVSSVSGTSVGIRSGGRGHIDQLSNTVINSVGDTFYYISCFAATSLEQLSQFNVTVPFYNGTIQEYLGAATDTPSLPSDDVFTGTSEDWTTNRDLLKPGEDDVIVVDNAPDLLGGAAQLLGAGDYVISIPDYLASIADAYNQALTAEAAVPVTLTDTATGVIVQDTIAVATPFEDVYVANDLATEHTGSGTGLTDAGDGVSGGAVAEALDRDLQDFFPFCIPWDIYRLIMLFQGTPRAPVFPVEWDSQYLEEPIRFMVDLSPWNAVAEIWRNCFKALFLMGLVLQSRKVINV